MKRFIASLLIMTGALAAAAKTPAAPAQNDTISVNSDKIERVVEHKTTNSKGKEVTKYYMLYEQELIPAAKTTVEAYNLAKQYGARCALVLVVNKKTNRKRIIKN